mgnify:FL=1
MPLPGTQPASCNTAPVSTLARLPLLCLLLLALVLFINSTSFGTKAAADPGFVSQIEHLVFAGNNDNSRLLPRFADLQPNVGDNPDVDWLAIAPLFGVPVAPRQTQALAMSISRSSPYRGNFHQQAPRAPPLV